MQGCRQHLESVGAIADAVLAAGNEFERALKALLRLDAALTNAMKEAGEVTLSHFVLATMEQKTIFAIYSGRVLSDMPQSRVPSRCSCMDQHRCILGPPLSA